jgi:hypothetical protein
MSPDEMNKRWPGMSPPSDEEMEKWRAQGGTGLPSADDLRKMRGEPPKPEGPEVPLPPTLEPVKPQRVPESEKTPEQRRKENEERMKKEREEEQKGGGLNSKREQERQRREKEIEQERQKEQQAPGGGGGGGGGAPGGGGAGGTPGGGGGGGTTPPEKTEPPKPEPPKTGEPGSGGPGGPGQPVPGGGPKRDLPWWLKQLEMPHGEPPSAPPPVVPMPRPRPPQGTPLDIDTTKNPPPAFTTPPSKERAPTDNQTKALAPVDGIDDAERKRLQEQQDIANEVWGRLPREPYGGTPLEKGAEPYPAPEGKTWVGIYGAGGKLLRRDLVIDTSRVRKGEGFFPFPHGGGGFLPKDTKVTRQPDGSMKYQTPDGKEFTIDKKGVQTGDPYLPAEDLPIYKEDDIPQFAAGGLVKFGDDDDDSTKPKQVLFGGEHSATADKKALAQAKSMSKSGVADDQIWNKTGWFKGVDGAWRYEIPDEKMKLDPKALSPALPVPLGAAVKHPEFQKAYPGIFKETSAIRLTDTGSGKLGSYDPDTKRLEVNPVERKMLGPDGKPLPAEEQPESPRQVMLHELQHTIQDKELFASGGGPGQFLKEAGGDPDKAIEMYRKLAGEVESRNVAKRSLMSPEERKKTPPWETMDVKEWKQIVKENEAPQYAVGGLVGDDDGELKRQREQQERRRQQELQEKQISLAANIITPPGAGGPPAGQHGGPGGPMVVKPPTTQPPSPDPTKKDLSTPLKYPPPSGPTGEPFKDLSRSPGLITSDPGLAARAKAQHFGEDRGGPCMPGTGQQGVTYERNLSTGDWKPIAPRPCIPVTEEIFQAAAAKVRGQISGFAEGGGIIGGHGSGTSDSNLAWVSKGEYIVRADGSNLHEAIDHFTKNFATGGIVGAFADSIRGYSDGGRVSASGAGGKDNSSYHQLDLRTDKGNFRVSVAQDTMEALRSSALAGKLSRTGERPSWFS